MAPVTQRGANVSRQQMADGEHSVLQRACACGEVGEQVRLTRVRAVMAFRCRLSALVPWPMRMPASAGTVHPRDCPPHTHTHARTPRHAAAVSSATAAMAARSAGARASVPSLSSNAHEDSSARAPERVRLLHGRCSAGRGHHSTRRAAGSPAPARRGRQRLAGGADRRDLGGHERKPPATASPLCTGGARRATRRGRTSS